MEVLNGHGPANKNQPWNEKLVASTLCRSLHPRVNRSAERSSSCAFMPSLNPAVCFRVEPFFHEDSTRKDRDVILFINKNPLMFFCCFVLQLS
mgnify:CR=1 FL=1